jgi:hypothetical protein
MTTYKLPVTAFSEKKNCPLNLSCIKRANKFTLGFPLQFTYDMCILTAPNPTVVPVYNSIDMEGRLVREAHLEGGNWVMLKFFLTCPQRSLCVLLGHAVLMHEYLKLVCS